MAVWKAFTVLKFRAFGTLSRTPVLHQKNEEKLSAIMLKLRRPKKPQNSFMKFLNRNRDELIHKNPGKSLTDITKLASEIWSDLPEKEKSPYFLEHKIEMQEYKSKMENYLKEVEKFQNKKLLNNGNKFNEAEKVLMGKPVKPAPPFFLFRASLRKISPSTTISMAEIKEKWDACDCNERKSFEDEYKKLVEKYRKDFLEWEKQMYNKGYTQLVRLNTLSKLKKSSAENH